MFSKNITKIAIQKNGMDDFKIVKILLKNQEYVDLNISTEDSITLSISISLIPHSKASKDHQN